MTAAPRARDGRGGTILLSLVLGVIASRVAQETADFGPTAPEALRFLEGINWATVEIGAIAVWTLIALERLSHDATTRYANNVCLKLRREWLALQILGVIAATQLSFNSGVYLALGTMSGGLVFISCVGGPIRRAVVNSSRGREELLPWAAGMSVPRLANQRLDALLGFLGLVVAGVLVTATLSLGAFAVAGQPPFESDGAAPKPTTTVTSAERTTPEGSAPTASSTTQCGAGSGPTAECDESTAPAVPVPAHARFTG